MALNLPYRATQFAQRVENVVVHDHGQHREIDGHEQVRRWLQWWLEAFPDATMEVRDALSAGEYSVTQFVMRGTNEGPMGPLHPTGRRAEVPICSIAHWRDG